MTNHTMAGCPEFTLHLVVVEVFKAARSSQLVAQLHHLAQLFCTLLPQWHGRVMLKQHSFYIFNKFTLVKPSSLEGNLRALQPLLTHDVRSNAAQALHPGSLLSL
jgi:hypothetical protein